MPDQDDSNSSSDDSSDENESTDGGGSNSNGMADQDDAYRRFVHTMTGYVMPNLSEVFDDLKGNSDIPMMRVEISGGSSDMWTTSRSVDDLSELYAKSSNPWFRQENTDVVIPFYSGGSAPGQKVTMKRARITLLGRRSTTDAPDAAGYQNGSEFSSDLKIGDQSSTTWDNRPVAQYVTGSGAALNKVLAGDSFRMGHNDSATVPYADSVKLQSLNDVADSFDRLATFFAGRKKDFDTWGSSLGKETMEWKGQAAGVFHDLIAGLNRIYTSYAKQFATTSAGKSVFGDELRETRETIEEAIREVRDAWSRWHATDGNPLRYVYDELIDTAEHMFNNNIFKVRYHPSTSSGGNYSTYSGGSHKIEDAGFTENAKDGGPLTDMSTWKAIGERAKRKWEATIEEKLVEPARTAEATVSDAFNKIDIPKSVNTVNVSLEAEYGKDVSARDRHEAALEKERMEREREEAETRAREEREEAEARAREEREEAENRMREEREEAENRAREEREEAEAKAEARAEAEKAEAQARYEEQKAEQEAKEEEARAQAEEDRALAEERYERDRADADAQRDEAQAQAERDRAEAQERYDQEKAEAEARADQLLGGGGNFGAMPLDPDAVDRANDLMGGGNPAFMAGMRTPGANLGQGSDDRERRDYDAAQQQQADQQQREAEERYREQQNRADQQQQDAMDRQEQLQREQQARADEIREGADQQRVQTESDYQERQSEAQRDAEARQQEIQREQEARQEEAQQRADEQQREAQQRQEEMQREQEARQEEAQARADEQQREAQQRQEEMQREQEARQEEAQARADEQQREAQERQQEMQRDQEAREEEARERAERQQQLSQERQEELRSRGDWRGAEAQRQADEALAEAQRRYQDQLRGMGGGDFGASNPAVTTLNPDGSLTVEYPDGTSRRIDGELTTQLPDGTVRTVNPATGEVTTVYPDGSTRTEFLSPGESIRDLATGTGPGGRSVFSPSTPGWASELDPSLPAQEGQGIGRGMPGGGMPMMPPGGRMGGGGGPGEMERSRMVHDDQVSQRQVRRPGMEAETIQAARGMPTSGGMPMMPPPMGGGAPGGGQQTESGGRERASWMEEEDDVWGSDEGGAPASIGR